VDISSKTTKEVGNIGESVATEYLKRKGFRILDRNIARKTGEIDIIAEKSNTLHFVEVKTNVVKNFPDENDTRDTYDPSVNLHPSKIRKVSRTGEWYVLEKEWGDEWQVDGCLVWIRRRDGMCKVRYLPQIV